MMRSSSYSIRYDVDLLPYNSFGIQSTAEIVCYPFNAEGVREVFQAFEGKKMVVLGNGTNVLLTKRYYDSSYIFISMKLMDSLAIDTESIVADAGVSLNKLVWFAVERGIGGYEFLEDIPGSIGGAVIMNAGTYSDNISQLIDKVSYFDISKNSFLTVNKQDLVFQTRKSLLSDGNKIVTQVRFVKSERNNDAYMESVNKILTIKENRYMKQPRNYPSAGSVFKRPIHNGKQEEVWRLVNDVGLRGYKIGGAMISEKHTGFIINCDNAKYEDIEELIQLIKDRVYSRYAISLEEEIKRI